MIVLHQYAGSPFAEKVRLILGFKGLAWSAVAIPEPMSSILLMMTVAAVATFGRTIPRRRAWP